MAILGKLIRQI